MHVRNIGRIRRYLTEDATKTIKKNALVTARLNYCNAVLYGLPASVTNRMQRLQNMCARMITRTRRSDHITPVVDNVVIQEPLGSSDHNQLHFNINIKSDKIKVKQSRRDFRRGNYEEIRTSLELIDWNDKMNNKTATECWNILRGELDSAIDSYVPMKKQGQRSKKKHLSKEAFR